MMNMEEKFVPTHYSASRYGSQVTATNQFILQSMHTVHSCEKELQTKLRFLLTVQE